METIYNMTYDYIFVDEISMVKEIFYKFFIMIKQLKPSIKFIIVGDYQQLKPIKDRIEINNRNFNYGRSQALLELSDGNKIQLSKCRRSDDVLYNMCKFENIMTINKDSFKSKFTHHHLAFTNKKRMEINKICMDELKLKYKKTKLYIDKNPWDPNSQDIVIYPNLPIICKVNDKELDIVNNEQFTVIKINDCQKIVIKNNEKELTITQEEFRASFYPAYCITIYASQGATFNFPYTKHEWEFLDNHLRYVSLTRATDINLINIY